MATLYELAKVLRSKNSGPFEVTVDILFEHPEYYEAVKASGLLTRETVSRLYHLPLEYINEIVFFDVALGIKITYARAISSGTVFDRDVYGAQQHAPILGIEIDVPIIQS